MPAMRASKLVMSCRWPGKSTKRIRLQQCFRRDVLPLHEVLLDTILSYPKLFADETPLPVLDPGRGKTKTCRLWVAAMDDRPWDGPAPPAVVYVFAEDRSGRQARDIFEGFTGVVQVDGYAGYNGLVAPGRVGGPATLAFC